MIVTKVLTKMSMFLLGTLALAVGLFGVYLLVVSEQDHMLAQIGMGVGYLVMSLGLWVVFGGRLRSSRKP